MQDNKLQIGGAFESPKDPRQVHVDELFGAMDMPEEFWSPYVIASILSHGVTNQGSQPDCVAEATARVNAALQLWNSIPDSVSDKDVIDYLFEVKNGRLQVKDEIKARVLFFSRRYIYSLAKKLDDMPTVEGTYLYMGPKIVVDFGSAEEHVYPTLYNLDKNTFKNAALIPEPAYKNAEPHKAERYAFAGRESWITQDQYKLAVWTSIGNCIVGGFNVGDNNFQPMVPPGPNEVRYGHSTNFFGFQKEYTYSIGSWGEGYGKSIKLKIINHPTFGKLFAEAKAGEDYIVELKGLHQFKDDFFSSGNMYRGVALYDEKFPESLEKRIKMPKLLREEVTNRVYAILNGKRYWMSPYESYADLQKAELIPNVGPDQIPLVSAAEIRKYPWGGVIGKISLADYIKVLTNKL